MEKMAKVRHPLRDAHAWLVNVRRLPYVAFIVLFYLNEGFSGGETRLIDYEVTIAPRRGSVLLFEHAMLHEGCPVTAGTKYVLRSDAKYWFEGSEER